MKQLILGGARSGKSALAEQRAGQSRLPVCYVATAESLDEEMAERIARHREQRPAGWRLVEEPLRLGHCVREHGGGVCLLIDCLTLWLSNLMALGDVRMRAERDDLLSALLASEGAVILVSNEVGGGIVPAHPLARRYRDEAGRLHQDVARLCDRVTLTVAGLPLELKGP